MIAAINDLPFGKVFSSKQEAVTKVRQWMKICKEIESEKAIAVTGLYSLPMNTSAEIAPGYPLIQLVKEFQTHDDRSYLIHLLANLGNPAPLPAAPFCMNGDSSFICAWARDGIVISLETDIAFGQPTLEGEIELQKASIKNISHKTHVEFYEEQLGIRRYEANPKHGKQPYMNAAGHYVDAMDLDNDEAQKLLERAVEIDGNLYAKRKGQYYCFQRHHKNYYHGYQNNELKLHIRNRIDGVKWE